MKASEIAPMKASAIALILSYLALEALWFAFAVPRLYTPLFAEVQGSPTVYRTAYALPAYALLVWALWTLVVGRARSRLAAARDATALALVAYGVHNLTNVATLARYPPWAAAVDTAWGVFAMNAATQVSISGSA
jgi:uncharacterized membrane protein